mmetsp:Transcript_18242/g.25916  ORF Transcript_18242/g.25916 Transcript_18242/m.25916 type:complete len:81 (+) Transcript_18242:568-810(+)
MVPVLPMRLMFGLAPWSSREVSEEFIIFQKKGNTTGTMGNSAAMLSTVQFLRRAGAAIVGDRSSSRVKEREVCADKSPIE